MVEEKMLSNVIDFDDDYIDGLSLEHIGVARRSGRYPWGSGDNPYQHAEDFLARIAELKKSGWTETPENIMKEFGMTTTEYRKERGLARDERRALVVAQAKSLAADNLGATAIGRELGVSESTVRSWLNAESEARMNKAKDTADFIRKQIETKGMIDVGTDVERELGISKEKLDQALHILEEEGYPIYKGGIPQVTNPGQQTNQKIICPKGTEHKEIYNYDQIHSLNEDNYISRDNGNSFEKKFTYPTSMDSKRLMIRYADDVGPDGAKGDDKDGIVELRRGVQDLSLGESRYSQVRILVDGTHYIKGMAVYSDNMPDGVDVVFNTNKKSDVPMKKVLKEIKNDPDNPFGSAIKDVEQGGQYWYDDATTGERKLGLINKRADEGDWTKWKDTLPSQFLGKQSLSLAKKQLGLAKADKLAEYEEICELTNPTIKKHLLEKFASNCDAAAADLKAAALPGQKYHVIIPINTLNDNEVYAPGYQNGTKLALIRYPHGGTFEIPILTVNNKNKLGNDIITKTSIDAVGINKKIADRLSGADFDGDTVMCIPTHDSSGKVKIKNREPLKDLEGFDPKTKYGADKVVKDADGTEHYYRNGTEYRLMKNPVTGKDSTQMQMGIVSNLITDMTLAGANDRELAAAVRHSMVVIDAGKHKLDYKQSEIDNNISTLKKKYQATVKEDGSVKYGGASTILSRSKGEYSVVKRQGTPKINVKGEEWYDSSRPEGALIYKTADDAYYTVTKTNKRTGEVKTTTRARTQKSTNMAETDDAFTLVSAAKHPMEVVYADYANSMKSLANQARLEMVNTGKIKYSSTAKKNYQAEVDSLMGKLNTALLNAPRERAAQRLANAEVKAKKEADPTMSKSDIKKASQQALSKYRTEVGSVSRRDRSIKITDKEWEAIQAGAISENKLKQILDNSDVDSLRERATPRSTTTLSATKINRIKAYSASNYTLDEIATKMGVSKDTVAKYLKGVN
jgi:transcriptional regulator with XRE-family HTH domain